MTARVFRILSTLILPATLLAAYSLLSSTTQSYYFPSLGEIGSAFADNWIFERVQADLLPSLIRTLIGFTLSLVIGVVAGLSIGLTPRLNTAVAPIVDFMRAIPPPVLIPFWLVLLGTGDAMKIAIIALGPTWPVLLNAIDGAREVDPTLTDTARSYRISKVRYVRRIVWPSALPRIVSGAKTSLSLALILMVISEMVASTSGIGYFVLEAQRTFSIPEMWSGIIILGLLGYAMSSIFDLVENRVLFWHAKARAGHSE